MKSEEVNRLLNEYKPSRETWSPVDEALYDTKKLLDLSENEAKKLRFNAIKYSYQHHFKNNYFYNRLCKEKKVSPNDIKTENDLLKIPLLPDTFFKDYPDSNYFLSWLNSISSSALPEIAPDMKNTSYDSIIDQLKQKGINIMFTSGTSGRFSFVPRDNITETRLKYSIFKSLSEFFDYKPESEVITLTPNPLTSHLAIARFFGYTFDIFDKSKIHVALKDVTINIEFLKNSMGLSEGISGKFKSKMIGLMGPSVQKKSDKHIISLLKKWHEKKEDIYIVGPPFWLNRILTTMEDKNIKTDFTNSFILTGGGWKIFEDKRMPETTFRKKITNVLGIPESNCRDTYAMTECNSMFLECEEHYKHVPNAIIKILVLDENLEVIGFDEYGRMAFLDPLANSYPGFIITGDRVKLLESCPGCDRKGPVLDTEVSRLPGVEGRGCAMVMNEIMNQEENNDD